ncbi:adenosylcobinamide-GDP ribazoletransferase [Mobilibacterium timonense]|uniref:adenosylcobinamide-GDP ribazoletransferase n=1 Tax=Mobilibacterium timonense TaxID=1871012 RepID=UPI00098591F3|nr:adenosylcobinamide-GDP ribazoletransferase [Mobilibacterium timonense]
MSIKSFLMAVSTYSALPVPQFEWTKENWQYAICWFPCVGILSGGLTAAWIFAAVYFGISRLLFACIAVTIPIVVTGGIHMDGFMDTVDAISSHQPMERKLEMLKDPHSGAFASIYACVYLIVSLGLFAQLGPVSVAYMICPGYVFSRSLSAFCAVTIKNARGSGMLNSFTEGIHKKKALAIIVSIMVISGAAMVAIGGRAAALPIVIGIIVTLWYKHFTIRTFGGCTGDTEGFFLQICELAMLAGTAIAGGVL